MNIVKKDGRIEEFSISKIRRSISNSSTEINKPLTHSDLKIIEQEVLKILKTINRGETSSYEIFGIVLKVLNHLGFTDVSQSYLKGSIYN